MNPSGAANRKYKVKGELMLPRDLRARWQARQPGLRSAKQRRVADAIDNACFDMGVGYDAGFIKVMRLEHKVATRHVRSVHRLIEQGFTSEEFDQEHNGRNVLRLVKAIEDHRLSSFDAHLEYHSHTSEGQQG